MESTLTDEVLRAQRIIQKAEKTDEENVCELLNEVTEKGLGKYLEGAKLQRSKHQMRYDSFEEIQAFASPWQGTEYSILVSVMRQETEKFLFICGPPVRYTAEVKVMGELASKNRTHRYDSLESENIYNHLQEMYEKQHSEEKSVCEKPSTSEETP